jgi:uncharacterized alkaline shock family protein YloU
MKATDRVFMTLLMLLIIALSVFVILFCLGVLPMLDLASAIVTIESTVVWKIVAVVASILLFILAVKVMFARTGGAGLDSAAPSAGLRSSNAEARTLIEIAPNVRITTEAINDIVQKSAQNSSSVTGATCHVVKQAEGPFQVRIGATVADGVSIPETAAEMDKRVKETLSHACGIGEVSTDIVIGK